MSFARLFVPSYEFLLIAKNAFVAKALQRSQGDIPRTPSVLRESYYPPKAIRRPGVGARHGVPGRCTMGAAFWSIFGRRLETHQTRVYFACEPGGLLRGCSEAAVIGIAAKLWPGESCSRACALDDACNLS